VAAWQNPQSYKGPPRGQFLTDLVEVLLGTGARIGEVLALRWPDSNLDAGTVAITGTVAVRKGGAVRQTFPKTDSGRRTLALPRFAVDVLLRRRVESLPNEHNVVFPSERGTILLPANVRRQWRAALEGTDLAEVTFKDLQKTVATLLSGKRDDETTAAQLGHSGVGTLPHYVERPHITPNVADTLAALAPGAQINP